MDKSKAIAIQLFKTYLEFIIRDELLKLVKGMIIEKTPDPVKILSNAVEKRITKDIKEFGPEVFDMVMEDVRSLINKK